MKWVCTVCGYVYEGPEAPAECPVCHVGADKFKKVEGEMTLAAEHEYGVYGKTVKNNADISEEDRKRAAYVLAEKDRVLAVCEALNHGDYETVGKKMYETHEGLSKAYEVSCPELDFLNDVAKACGVTGSRMMGGGFGGCTINLVKDELYDSFVNKAKTDYYAKFNKALKVYDIVISDGAHKICD